MVRLVPLALVAAAAGALAACNDTTPARAPAPKERAHLVEVAAAARAELAYSTVRTGTLSVRHRVKLFNQEEGRIEEVAAYEGDRVEAGSVLVRLDRRLLQAELQKARATREQADSDLARVRRLVERQLAPADALERARTALKVAEAEERLLRTRLEYAELRAPFDGVVTARNAEPGDVAPRHTHLLSLMDPDSLYTEVSVSELLLPVLRDGARVEVRVDALPDRVLEGRIARIHPTVDRATRQGIVEVDLTDVPPEASPGALCRVTLRTRATERLLVPFAALRRDPEGEHVFVVDGERRAQRRAVETGLRIDQRVEVLAGLEAGERVVVKGFLGLIEGGEVRVPEGNARAAPEAGAT